MDQPHLPGTLENNSFQLKNPVMKDGITEMRGGVCKSEGFRKDSDDRGKPPKMEISRYIAKEDAGSPIPLIISGQGVFVFSTDSSACSFHFSDATGDHRISFDFSHKHIHAIQISNNKSKKLKCQTCKKGISKKPGAYYWVSIDAQNQQLYAGIGEARLETAVYKYQHSNKTANMHKKTKAFLESLTHVKFEGIITPIKILRDPITSTVPLLVKDTDSLSMGDIASGNYLPKANLSAVAQKLYDCISGKKFVLDDADFPEFTKAIEYSIATPGMWCHETLKNKSTEFNKNKPNRHFPGSCQTF
jgi:hypothetical protein